jgi:hypothetical protein
MANPAIFVKQVRYVATPVTNTGEWISIKAAADLHGCDMSYIIQLMERNELPEAVYDTVARKPRYTLRSAVEKLPPYKKRERVPLDLSADMPLSSISRTRRDLVKAARQDLQARAVKLRPRKRAKG